MPAKTVSPREKSSLTAPRILALIGFCLIAVGQLGRIFAPADSLNYLAPLYLIPSAGAALWLFLAGRVAGVLLLALVLAVGLDLSGIKARPAPNDQAPILRLVEFNVWKDNPAPETAATWIEKQNPDVVILAEAAKAGGEIRHLLATQFPYAVDCYGGVDDGCSTVVMSRRPFLASGGLAQDDSENRRGLSAAWARVASPEGPVTVIGVHYRRPWPFDDQSREVRQLAAFIAAQDRARLVVAGDFNLPAWTFAIKRQDKAFGLDRMTRGLATWPAADGRGRALIPLLSIDQVYLGSAMTARLKRGPFLRSDHRPLVIALEGRKGF